MNKRKLGIISLAVLMLIFILIICVKCNKNEKDINQSSGDYYNENQNSIAISTKTFVTETKKKTIEVGAFQKAKIVVDKFIESGDVEIEITDIENNNVQGIYSGDNNEQIIFEIPEGLGRYTISMDLKEFIGQCILNWEVTEINNFKLFTSTMGYELKYDPSLFDVRYTADSETFVYNKEEDIYLKVYTVLNTNAEKEKESIYENAKQTGACEVSNGTLVGEYVSTKIENTNMIKRNLIFELEDKSLLIIEICEHEKTEKVQFGNEHIKNMIQTFMYE